MARKKTYYALWDEQYGRRMATGCNCTTKTEVKEQLWAYYEPDRKEIFLTDNIRKVTLQLLLEIGEFTLEQSDVPFDDEY